MTRDTAENMMALADDVEQFQDDAELDLMWEALAFINEPGYLARMDGVNDVADIISRYGSIPIRCE